MQEIKNKQGNDEFCIKIKDKLCNGNSNTSILQYYTINKGIFSFGVMEG